MRVIGLAGNPNVGKSTIFNALTGMKQHTGNWPGKTVELAQGTCTFKGQEYRLVDLPGTYSLISCSQEEGVAEDFLLSEEADCTLVVCDATCLERSLILALQVIALTPKTVICVNLMDEARRAGLQVDLRLLERRLGVPVVGTSGSREEGLPELMEAVRALCEGFVPVSARPGKIRGETEQESDEIARQFVRRAEELTKESVQREETRRLTFTERMDRVLLHRRGGYVVMFLLLLGAFWLTMEGANYPSEGLQWCFDRLGEGLLRLLRRLRAPGWLTGALLDGIYDTMARVVAVMLPPMAIFFPLFTILEDFGYLPRAAFLLDERFRSCGACGKQSLTLCMGIGCNAAGVTGCRIIDSPRERLIAILTNAFVPCNGRFPALIFLISLSFSQGSTVVGAVILTLCLLLSFAMTLAASKFLSKTVLKGEASSFVLELPPYRRPKILQVLIRSFWDRTLFILGRAVMVAAPAGLVIWLLANTNLGGTPLLQTCAEVLNFPAKLIGLNGAILLAFLLGSPANELVLPILMMVLTAGGSFGRESTSAMAQVLAQFGWTWKESLCTMIFFLFHWPCATTVLTIHKETKSWKWTALSILLPTAFGIGICGILNLIL